MHQRILFLVLVCVPAIAFAQATTASSGLSAAELEAASRLGESISTSEWLGPLAPVALSPFFGMACLAGLAQFGPDSLISANHFLSAESPLHSPVIFWTFAVLATVTSLPRLTKVSKPIAGALEQLESYSSIITLVAIRYLVTGGDAPLGAEEVVYDAGLGALSVDALLSIAAAINVVVINAVKFFFEFLIWLVPFPAVDAVFEVANKAAVTGLMAIYSFSPFAATVLNLILLAICGVIFLWTRRQVVFLRTILVGWVLSWLRTGHPPTTPELIVFPTDEIGPFPARERLTLSRTPEGLVLTKRRLFGSPLSHPVVVTSESRIQPGWIAHSIILCDNDAGDSRLLLSRSVTKHLDVIAALLRLHLVDDEVVKQPIRDQIGPLKTKPV